MIGEQSLDFDVYAEYDIVLSLHEEIAAILQQDSSLLEETAGDVSGWSACMQIQHICMANNMVTTGLLAIVRSELDGVRSGNVNRLGKVLLGRGVIPRGKADAPDQYKPQPGTRLETVQALFNKVDSKLVGIGNYLDDIAALSDGFDHPYFGTLPAPVWVRFMHVHTLHHLKIVRDIVAALDDT